MKDENDCFLWDIILNEGKAVFLEARFFQAARRTNSPIDQGNALGYIRYFQNGPKGQKPNDQGNALGK